MLKLSFDAPERLAHAESVLFLHSARRSRVRIENRRLVKFIWRTGSGLSIICTTGTIGGNTSERHCALHSSSFSSKLPKVIVLCLLRMLYCLQLAVSLPATLTTTQCKLCRVGKIMPFPQFCHQRCRCLQNIFS